MPVAVDHFALVVGIDHYPLFRSLQGARRDARTFHDWLIDPQGGAVPDENVALVLSEENAGRPIHDDIDLALKNLLDKARAGSAKRLYVYFSGHGLASSNMGANLCLAPWSKDRRKLALDSGSYLEMAMGSGFFREVVFLLDCCRVREHRSAGYPPSFDYPVGDGAATCRKFVGYATEYMNAAYEAEVGLDETNGEVRGHFTQALIDALSGGAADSTGGVRASRLKEYLEVNTPLIARRSKHIQKPEIVNGLDSADDPVFGHAKPSPSAKIQVHLTFVSVTQGEVMVEDGRLREIKRGDASTGPWSLSVESGTMLLMRHLPSGKEAPLRIPLEQKEDSYVQF